MLMSETVDLFLRQIALIAVVLVLHTYLGLHIIRRTLIFCDLVLDQLAAFGALVGVALHIRYGSPLSYMMAMAAVLVGALLLAVIKPKSREIPREAVIGILYAMALVVSLLLTDKLPGGDIYVEKTLAGYMSWVSWPLVIVTIAVYIALLLFHYKFRHRFITLAENPGALKDERLWDFLFFTSQGIITVLIVPIAGVLLAYSFLMIPAGIAAMFTSSWAGAVVLGWTVGFVACLIGLGSSYCCDFTYGPTLVLSLGLCFVIAIIVRWLLSRRSSNNAKGD
jgi:zinc/manganese transport system permease protein